MVPTAQGAQARHRRVAWATAALANLALLALLASPGRDFLSPPAGPYERPIDVELLAPPPRPTAAPEPRSGAARPPSQQAPSQQAPSPQTPLSQTPGAITRSPVTAAGGGGEGASNAPGIDAGVAQTLRRGIGCANPGAPWMSDTDREACRQHLAAGAMKAPYVSGMPAAKLAYYQAVSKAYEDFRSGRNPGHPPIVYCGFKFGAGKPRKTTAPPHALTFGPCFIDPPAGSLSVDVDIAPPDTARPDDTITPAGSEPIRHLGQQAGPGQP